MLLAQNLDSIQKNGLRGFTGGANVGEFVTNSKILDYVFGAAAILLLIYLVTAGLQMMTSRGDPKAMQGAQAKITNALIGFVLIIMAYLLVSLIGKVFGLEVFTSLF